MKLKNIKHQYLQAFTILIAVAIVFLLIDRFAGSPELVSGMIYDNKHEADISYQLGRQASPISHESDSYTLDIIVNDERITVDCDADIYLKAHYGQGARLILQKGSLTGWNWVKEIVSLQ